MPRAHAAWPPPSDDSAVDYSDPMNWPNDPDYAGAWNYWSFVPSTIRAPGRRGHQDARHRHAPRSRVGQDAGRSARARRRHRLGHRVERRRADQPALLEPRRAAAADGLPRLATAPSYDVNGDGKLQRARLHDHDRPHARAGGDGVRPARQRQERQRHHRSRGSDLVVLRRQGRRRQRLRRRHQRLGLLPRRQRSDGRHRLRPRHRLVEGRLPEPMDGKGGIGTCPDCTRR